ncbi:L,D-transpeptidase family protein [Streptomyces sp. KK5PA1]|uniref:L,D-transpeptidase family protein n=1 Tax=Actinacidiphila acididurans TaxID=2784346 RepID=A0ABS2TMQ7_9ACTN|nr:L,D-transpeptidase family protein [Actinacidiphila acididurans]
MPGVLTATLLALAALLLAGCGAPGVGSGDDAGRTARNVVSGTAVSAAAVAIAPADGATDVATSGTLKVTASGGELSSVVVKDASGLTVPGAISADGAVWAPTARLRTATAYTVDATARDSRGRESDRHSAFTTVVPDDTFVGFVTPQDGAEVGVGMEVWLHFNRAVTDRAAVARGLTVTAAPPVAVAAKWYGDQDVYLRPQKFWAPGTRVTLAVDLAGVRAAPGVYGRQRESVHFTVARSQVSVVDAARHTMSVYRDGRLLRALPVTAGVPGHDTPGGTLVIAEKYGRTRMTGDTAGFGGEYDIPDVPHAMRLTTSGTFLYGDYWSPPAVFGTADTSHGGIGLRDARGGADSAAPAAWFFANSLVGDVVEVTGGSGRSVQWYNGLNGWNLDWPQWTAL